MWLIVADVKTGTRSDILQARCSQRVYACFVPIWVFARQTLAYLGWVLVGMLDYRNHYSHMVLNFTVTEDHRPRCSSMPYQSSYFCGSTLALVPKAGVHLISAICWDVLSNETKILTSRKNRIFDIFTQKNKKRRFFGSSGGSLDDSNVTDMTVHRIHQKKKRKL